MNQVDALSFIVHREFSVIDRGKVIVEKLTKNLIPRQNLKCQFQATIGNKVVARS